MSFSFNTQQPSSNNNTSTTSSFNFGQSTNNNTSTTSNNAFNFSGNTSGVANTSGGTNANQPSFGQTASSASSNTNNAQITPKTPFSELPTQLQQQLQQFHRQKQLPRLKFENLLKKSHAAALNLPEELDLSNVRDTERLHSAILEKLDKIHSFSEKLHQRLETVKHSIRAEEKVVDDLKSSVSQEVKDVELLKAKFQNIQAPSMVSHPSARYYGASSLSFYNQANGNEANRGTRSSSGYFMRVASGLEQRMHDLWRQIEDVENTINISQQDQDTQAAPQMLQDTLQRQQDAFLNIATKVAIFHEEAEYLRDTYKTRFVKDSRDPFARPKTTRKGVGYSMEGWSGVSGSRPTLPGLTLPDLTSGAPPGMPATGGNTANTGGGFNFGTSTNKPATSGGFNFGNTSSNTNTGATGGGFNFGNTSTTGGGNTNTGGSGGFNFGSSTNKPATGGFNFGNTSSNTNTGSTGGGFNFGNTSTTGGGNTNTGGSGGFNFGSTSNTSGGRGGTSGGFNFGSTSSNTNTGSTGGGFNFGNTNTTGGGNTSTSGSGGFNFGSTSNTSGGTGATSGGFSFSSPRRNPPPAIQT